MTNRLQFEHRQPRAHWKNRPFDAFEIPVQKVERFAQEILEIACNMSIGEGEDSSDVDSLIYKSSTIRDQMLDLQEMIESLQQESKKVESSK